MTELAHGSNVQGIETTATFDKETDEFVINTPHIVLLNGGLVVLLILLPIVPFMLD